MEDTLGTRPAHTEQLGYEVHTMDSCDSQIMEGPPDRHHRMDMNNIKKLIIVVFWYKKQFSHSSKMNHESDQFHEKTIFVSKVYQTLLIQIITMTTIECFAPVNTK